MSALDRFERGRCRACRVPLLLALGAFVVGCGAPRPPEPPTGLEWRRLHADLAALRAAHEPTGPYTIRLALELREPRTGRSIRARGAAAVDPSARAFRMILLGPGGTTALDLWSCADRFRVAIPAVELVRRGDARSPDEASRGLPVEFLRWWLLEPLAGRLLHAARGDDGARFVLERRGAVLDVQTQRAGGLRVERRRAGGLERVVSGAGRCPEVRYAEQSTGLDIRVSCEGIDVERPVSDAALADPDDPTLVCRPAGGSAP